jgi:multimeric flavodoxin WrbA
MKVVLLSGSPKPSGNTALLMQECAKVIEASGVETEIISFAGKKIEACIGCGRCAKEGKCGLNDGLNEIIDKIRVADGLIVGTPVYFGTARGDVMCALQRIGYVSRNTDNFLTGKVGGPVAVARRGGQTLTLQEMLMFFLINDMIVPGSNYWNMVFGRTPGEALQDAEGVATVRHFAENVANLVKKLHAVAPANA